MNRDALLRFLEHHIKKDFIGEPSNGDVNTALCLFKLKRDTVSNTFKNGFSLQFIYTPKL